MLLHIDELNTLKAEISEIVRTVETEAEHYDSIDFLIDLLASTVITTVEEYLEQEYNAAYATGIDGWIDSEPDETTRRAAIYAKVGGKSFDERIVEYLSDGLDGFESKINTLIDTDGHRIRQEATLDAGESLHGVGLTVTKTWNSVKIPTTRDTHYLLDGTTIPLNEQFETVNGKTLAPGCFGVAEEDVNCLCYLTIQVTE